MKTQGFKLEVRRSVGHSYPLPSELEEMLRFLLQAGNAQGNFVATARWPVKGNQELYEQPNFRPPRLTMIEAKIHPGGGNENARNVLINCPSAQEALRLYYTWCSLFESYTITRLRTRHTEYGVTPKKEADKRIVNQAEFDCLKEIILLVADPQTVGVTRIDEDAFKDFTRTLFALEECPALYDDRVFTRALNELIDGGHGIRVIRRRILDLGEETNFKPSPEGWSNTDHPGDRIDFLIAELTEILKSARKIRPTMRQLQNDLEQIEGYLQETDGAFDQNEHHDTANETYEGVDRVFADLRRQLIACASQL